MNHHTAKTGKDSVCSPENLQRAAAVLSDGEETGVTGMETDCATVCVEECLDL